MATIFESATPRFFNFSFCIYTKKNFHLCHYLLFASRNKGYRHFGASEILLRRNFDWDIVNENGYIIGMTSHYIDHDFLLLYKDVYKIYN